VYGATKTIIVTNSDSPMVSTKVKKRYFTTHDTDRDTKYKQPNSYF